MNDPRKRAEPTARDIEAIVARELQRLMPKYLQGHAFTARKLTDMPSDANQVVPRRFVTLNGTTAQRPTGSILGQMYFDTDDGAPRGWNGSTWVDSGGTPA